MITAAALNLLKSGLRDIQQQLQELKGTRQTAIKLLIAMEFMAAVLIRRTRFDELVKLGRVKAFRKSRKIYVLVEEADRYFSDKSVQ